MSNSDNTIVRRPKIIFSLRSMRTGESYPITGEITVGRELDCAIRLNSPHVSRYHAKIRPHRDELIIEDLGSSNGTFVNGKQISGQHNLMVGDKVTFDDITFRITSPNAGKKLVQPPMPPSDAPFNRGLPDEHTDLRVDESKLRPTSPTTADKTQAPASPNKPGKQPATPPGFNSENERSAKKNRPPTEQATTYTSKNKSSAAQHESSAKIKEYLKSKQVPSTTKQKPQGPTYTPQPTKQTTSKHNELKNDSTASAKPKPLTPEPLTEEELELFDDAALDDGVSNTDNDIEPMVEAVKRSFSPEHETAQEATEGANEPNHPELKKINKPIVEIDESPIKDPDDELGTLDFEEISLDEFANQDTFKPAALRGNEPKNKEKISAKPPTPGKPSAHPSTSVQAESTSAKHKEKQLDHKASNETKAQTSRSIIEPKAPITDKNPSSEKQNRVNEKQATENESGPSLTEIQAKAKTAEAPDQPKKSGQGIFEAPPGAKPSSPDSKQGHSAFSDEPNYEDQAQNPPKTAIMQQLQASLANFDDIDETQEREWKQHEEEREHIVTKNDGLLGEELDPTPQLVMNTEPDIGRVFPLTDDKSYWIIGRDPNADIYLDEDLLAREHAKVSKISDTEFAIKTCQSTNGMLINGKFSAGGTLNHGDTVQFGRIEISFKHAMQQKQEILERSEHSRRNLRQIDFGTWVGAAVIATAIIVSFAKTL